MKPAHDGYRREIVAALQRQGWRVHRTRNNHVRAVPPDPTRPIVVTGSTPSCSRANANWLAALKRAGFRWPEPVATQK